MDGGGERAEGWLVAEKGAVPGGRDEPPVATAGPGQLAGGCGGGWVKP
jgi:hypothetical protein